VASAHQGWREPGNGIGRFHNNDTKPREGPRGRIQYFFPVALRGAVCSGSGRGTPASRVSAAASRGRPKSKGIPERSGWSCPGGFGCYPRPVPGGGVEMGVRALSVTLLLSILATGGCGTFTNLARPGPEAGGKSPFGGVSHDMACIRDASNGEPDTRAHAQPESDQLHRGALVLLYAADLPLSFIGDVVTWPYVVAYTCINQPVPTPPVIVAPAVAPNPPPPSLPAPPPEPLPKPTKLP
jgi:uncharacterized protein YceK